MTMAGTLEKMGPRFWDTSWNGPCKFNVDGCLTLEEITSSFSAPITEEHAWAVVFECVKCLHGMLESKPLCSGSRRVFQIVSNTRQIFIHREGRVHESTFLLPENGGDVNENHENTTSSKLYFV